MFSVFAKWMVKNNVFIITNSYLVEHFPIFLATCISFTSNCSYSLFSLKSLFFPFCTVLNILNSNFMVHVVPIFSQSCFLCLLIRLFIIWLSLTYNLIVSGVTISHWDYLLGFRFTESLSGKYRKFSYTSPCTHTFALFKRKKNVVNVYLFWRERETMGEQGMSRERETWDPKQALSCQHRARRGARIHALRDHDLKSEA